jgi:hypothetical protein
MLLRRASASKGERKPLTFEIRTKIKYVSEQSAPGLKSNPRLLELKL